MGDLNSLFKTKLKESNIDEALAKKLKFKLMEQAPTGLPAQEGGFVIPYFDLKGSPTSFWRYRYLEDTRDGFAKLTDAKALRYVQQSETLNELYLPPLVKWADVAKDTNKPVIITEGELKSACATAYTQYPTIGLGGVWCFRSASNRMHLLPMFNNFQWKDRPVFIVYDSDAASNPKVISAENELARELLRLGADVRIVRMPAIEGLKKTGLDDYIVARGGNGAVDDLLDRSFQWAAGKELHMLNEEVIYVRDPGLIVKMATGQRIAPRAFVEHAFSTRVYHEEVVTEKSSKLVEKSAPKEWLKWPFRAEVEAIVYEPGQESIVDGSLNTWRGWGCQPKRGSVEPWRELLDFLFKGKPAERKWFEQWCAYPIQHPGFKLYSCAMVWGRAHGTGKSFVGYSLFKIYGDNSIEVGDEQIESTYNDWQENKQFIMGDEITGDDKRSTANKLKKLVTQEQILINRKYIPTFRVRDCVNWYFNSNQPDSLFVEDDDRRLFIHEVVGQPLAREFYMNYENWIGKPGVVGPGAPALFYHLLNIDLTGFDPRGPAPFTDAKRDMINLGRSDLGTWVHTLCESPDTVLKVGDVTVPYALWRSEDLLRMYDPEGRGKVTSNGMSRELRRQGFRQAYGGQGVPTKTDGQVRLWVIRPDRVPERIASSARAGAVYDEERQLKAKYSK